MRVEEKRKSKKTLLPSSHPCCLFCFCFFFVAYALSRLFFFFFFFFLLLLLSSVLLRLLSLRLLLELLALLVVALVQLVKHRLPLRNLLLHRRLRLNQVLLLPLEHFLGVRALRVPVEHLPVHFEEVRPPRESLQRVLSLVLQPHDVQRRGDRLDAGQLHRLAEVDGVGRNHEGEQPRRSHPHFRPRHVIEPRPRAVHNAHAELLHALPVSRRHSLLALRREHNAHEGLCELQRVQLPHALQLLSGAPPSVALLEVPHGQRDREVAGSLRRGAASGVLVLLVAATTATAPALAATPAALALALAALAATGAAGASSFRLLSLPTHCVKQATCNEVQIL
eukprot:Rhum_TRINITY_DN15470_c12_g1::Rhum_TRINITY_DN15470_c12_g1_i1::g.158765::m.158765